MQPCEFHTLFYTPVWRYEYPDFKDDQEALVKYFTNDDIYISERERNKLQITRANIHKDEDPLIVKLSEWIKECCRSSMIAMGLQPDIGITSMWATRTAKQGYHHPHFHGNCFLAGVMHLWDVDGNASGTVFENTEAPKYVIQPASLEDGNNILKYEEHLPFIPGTAIVFPSFAKHRTMRTDSRYRVVIGFNTMPIGMTNIDHYDRYNYSDPSEMALKEYEE
jgi:uncharacterized protein (DUF934 family)